MNECYAFECWLKDEPTWTKVINARSRGKAKVQYFRDVSDSWEIDYRDIRSRKMGNPVTSERFIHNAKYRGMPDVRCGQKVEVLGNKGFIVGHNSSANFDVLFDDDAPHYAGLTLNVHPNDIELV